MSPKFNRKELEKIVQFVQELTPVQLDKFDMLSPCRCAIGMHEPYGDFDGGMEKVTVNPRLQNYLFANVPLSWPNTKTQGTAGRDEFLRRAALVLAGDFAEMGSDLS